MVRRNYFQKGFFFFFLEGTKGNPFSCGIILLPEESLGEIHKRVAF